MESCPIPFSYVTGRIPFCTKAKSCYVSDMHLFECQMLKTDFNFYDIYFSSLISSKYSCGICAL